jgi:hypothetical protein
VRRKKAMNEVLKDMYLLGTGIMQGDQRIDPEDFFLPLEKEEAYNKWLHEIEGFSSRSERLYEDFPEVKNLKRLRGWLEAAFLEGYKSGANSMKQPKVYVDVEV